MSSKSRSWRGITHTTLCDKVCQWRDRSVVFSDTPVSSTNKTDRHDITEILLKVAFKRHNPPYLYPKMDVFEVQQLKYWLEIFRFTLHGSCHLGPPHLARCCLLSKNIQIRIKFCQLSGISFYFYFKKYKWSIDIK